jgi:hypothetical protein
LSGLRGEGVVPYAPRTVFAIAVTKREREVIERALAQWEPRSETEREDIENVLQMLAGGLVAVTQR